MGLLEDTPALRILLFNAPHTYVLARFPKGTLPLTDPTPHSPNSSVALSPEAAGRDPPTNTTPYTLYLFDSGCTQTIDLIAYTTALTRLSPDPARITFPDTAALMSQLPNLSAAPRSTDRHLPLHAPTLHTHYPLPPPLKKARTQATRADRNIAAPTIHSRSTHTIPYHPPLAGALGILPPGHRISLSLGHDYTIEDITADTLSLLSAGALRIALAAHSAYSRPTHTDPPTSTDADPPPNRLQNEEDTSRPHRHAHHHTGYRTGTIWRRGPLHKKETQGHVRC